MPIRVPGEENLEGLEPLDQALGVVEAVDPNDERPSAEAGHQVLDQRRAHVSAREHLELPRLDADGEAADPGLPTVRGKGDLVARRFEYPHVATRILILGHEIANEISGIALGLEADHVILQQQRDELLVVGQGCKQLRRRHRDMKEEANAVGMAAAAQRVRDRDHVIVMNPDEVIGFDDLF